MSNLQNPKGTLNRKRSQSIPLLVVLRVVGPPACDYVGPCDIFWQLGWAPARPHVVLLAVRVGPCGPRVVLLVPAWTPAVPRALGPCKCDVTDDVSKNCDVTAD